MSGFELTPYPRQSVAFHQSAPSVRRIIDEYCRLHQLINLVASPVTLSTDHSNRTVQLTLIALIELSVENLLAPGDRFRLGVYHQSGSSFDSLDWPLVHVVLTSGRPRPATDRRLERKYPWELVGLIDSLTDQFTGPDLL